MDLIRPARSPAFAERVNQLLTEISRSLLPVLLDTRGAKAGEPVLLDRELPREEFLGRQGIALACLLKREQAAATTSALRRITHRLVEGGGKSAIVSGEPSGPITYLTLGR
jgi:hypothetical protein